MPKKATKEDFIEKANKVHSSKYDYSKVEYTGSKNKVCIICPEHGEFWQIPNSHVLGKGCSKCSNQSPMDTKTFISKAIKIHGDTYDYSKVVYSGVHSEVVIVCREHGEFKQKPTYHLNTTGCPKCMSNRRIDTEEFISRARKVHGTYYDYSKVKYVNGSEKVKILCPTHGEFKQNPLSHLKGSRCAKCVGVARSNTKEFIAKAKLVHGMEYSYSNVVYKNNTDKVKITCELHGDFEQPPVVHLNGSKCPKCSSNLKMNTELFTNKAKAVHGDKYGYGCVKYSSVLSPVSITCKKHGNFKQKPTYHLNGRGCPKCAHSMFVSKAEQSIADTLRANGLEVLQSNRAILGKFELDIVIPEKKIAIEFNGTYWHSEANGKGKEYHRNKTNLANQAGYRLIHIWEDDFTADPDREIKFILNACGLTSKKCIYARKTTIGEVSPAEAVKFLAENHVQGSVGASVKLGTYHGSELVAVTLFSKRNYGYELVRHAASVKVVGGLGKVVKHFHREHQVDIHSFCDISRHDGRSYEAAGFVKSGELKPDYKYVVNGKREHKFGFRLASIKVKYPEVYSPSKSERQMMEEAGVPRIWDCGKTRYIFS